MASCQMTMPRLSSTKGFGFVASRSSTRCTGYHWSLQSKVWLDSGDEFVASTVEARERTVRGADGAPMGSAGHENMRFIERAAIGSPGTRRRRRGFLHFLMVDNLRSVLEAVE